MKNLKLNGNDLRGIGFKTGPVYGIILSDFVEEFKHLSKKEAVKLLRDVSKNPDSYLKSDNSLFKIAEAIIPKVIEKKYNEYDLLDESKPYSIYGKDNIEKGALDQMNIATKLPIAKKGALLPDAHQGYGLPIGGVLATDNAIIPYAVGVDIACRMALTLYDLPVSYLDGHKNKIKNILDANTFFGMGVSNDTKIDAEVLDNKLFNEINILTKLKDVAWRQLGSSGSGNHFVEFGIVDVDDSLGLDKKQYIGLLSHSGSRGLGANIAKNYTNIAIENCILPKSAKHLAWLDLNSEEGQEYWLSMHLAGDYAKACHDEIHRRVAKKLGWKTVLKIENHHNFAWKEIVDGEELIVHRKGATPAGEGVLGIIPGSMATSGYIIKGKGNIESINSASHGAGRLMSRTKCKENITKSDMKKVLRDNNITLIGADLDEAPQAYKNIDDVMSAQVDLVDVIGKFTPKIVKMA